jgi:opacity protein-like surface antigen
MLVARLTVSTLALAAAFATNAARAADYSQPLPQQPIVYQQPQVDVIASGWYLRGDIGFSNQQVRNLFNAQDLTAETFTNVDKGFDSAPFFGVGIGYYFNDWLRFDLTGEYRGKANFHGMDIYSNGGVFHDDSYSASKSELTFLLNGYVDLGTWYNVTPFVGAGVGFSRNTISSFRDIGLSTGSDAYADTASKWSFAWALHAGLAYKVSKNFTVELAYRYLDLGNATTGNAITFDGTVFPPFEFQHLTSHDVKIGLRFNLDGFADYARPIQYYQPPAYTPPPVYLEPPPLRSKG